MKFITFSSSNNIEREKERIEETTKHFIIFLCEALRADLKKKKKVSFLLFIKCHNWGQMKQKFQFQKNKKKLFLSLSNLLIVCYFFIHIKEKKSTKAYDKKKVERERERKYCYYVLIQKRRQKML
jgi:hypothetical protein